MSFSVTTWNINSVRLRIEQVRRFLAEQRPDVLCLQETKCPNDRFPLKDLMSFGYPYVAHTGQKGYNGVAVLSRHPFSRTESRSWCERDDARHLAVTLGPEAGAASGIVIHNFYVPAGGDIPDPEANPKFAHKLQFLEEMRGWSQETAGAPTIVVGDLNVAPLENDVWSHRQLLDVVSHTPVETEALERLRREAGLVDAVRHLRPEPERVYTWWSYRSPDWAAADRGRRLDHVWVTEDLGRTVRHSHIARDCRSWTQPSDHVPVTVTLAL